jgi:hypothetical protein
MDPLTLALLAGGASLVGGLPDIIPSKYEKDQKKELEKLQRQQELGTLGLSQREQNALMNQLQGQLSQGAAATQAEIQRLSAPTAQPGQAMLGAQLAAMGQQQALGQAQQQLNALNLQKKAEQEQQIRDLAAAQAEYKRQRQEALVAPLTQGIEAFIGGQNLAALSGTAQPGLLEQRKMAIAAEGAKNDALVSQALAVSRMQEEWGLTQQQAEEFYKSSDWANLSPETQSYYTRIK